MITAIVAIATTAIVAIAAVIPQDGRYPLKAVLKAPISVDLSITHRCNHRCIHCYNWWESPSVTPISQLREILKSIVDSQVKYVTITGGEPLMDTDGLYFAIEYCSSHDIGVTLNTNCTLMTEEIAHRLGQMAWSKSILVSLPSFDASTCDSITRIPGSFDNIMKGMSVARSNGMRITTNTVVSQKNIETLTQYHDVFDHFLPDSIAITMAVPTCSGFSDSMGKNDYDIMCRAIEQIETEYHVPVRSLNPIPLCMANRPPHGSSCAAGITSCCIDADTGAVTACSHSDVKYGSVLDEPLNVIWSRMSDWRADKYLSPICKTCENLDACGGQCRIYSLLKIDTEIQAMPASTLSSERAFDEGGRYVMSAFRIREEEDFFTIITKQSTFFIDSDGLELINTLHNLRSFDIDVLSQHYEVDEGLIKTLDKFLRYGLIVPV